MRKVTTVACMLILESLSHSQIPLKENVNASAPGNLDLQNIEEELTRTYCEYQQAFILLTYEFSNDGLDGALKSAQEKVDHYVKAYTNAKMANVSKDFELACDIKDGYSDYRGMPTKHLFLRYDPPFKRIKLKKLNPLHPSRWLAAYKTNKRRLERRLFFWWLKDNNDPKAWKRTALNQLEGVAFTFLTCGMNKGFKSLSTIESHVELLIGYWALWYSVYFAKAVQVSDGELLKCNTYCNNSANAGNIKPITFAEVKEKMFQSQRFIAGLVEKINIMDKKRWIEHYSKLKGDKLILFRKHCQYKSTCKIINRGRLLKTPEELKQAAIWVTEPIDYEETAYRFLGDKVVGEAVSYVKSLPRNSSWGDIVRSARATKPIYKTPMLPAE